MIGPVKINKIYRKAIYKILPYENKSMNDSDEEGGKRGGFHTLRHFQHVLREVTQDPRSRRLETCKSRPSL